MPNSKKKRTAKYSPNTAGAQRAAIQLAAHHRNLANPDTAPWQKAKNKRRHLRILAGKPTQFMRKQAAKSNYKTTGPSAVPNSKLAFEIKPGTGISYN